MRATLAVLALALLLTPACVGSRWMRSQAFVPPLRHYRVRYADAANRALLPAGWSVLNHDGGGVRGDARWWTDAWIEPQDGGSQQLAHVPRFDLYAEQEQDGATVLLRTVPLPARLGRRSLDVLAHDLVDDGLGEGITLVEDPGRGVRVVSSTIVEETPAEVGGVEAYYVTVQVSVMGARAGSAELVTLVLLRPGAWRWRASGIADHEGAAMIVIAAYQASAEHYALHVADFTSLLARLDVRP